MDRVFPLERFYPGRDGLRLQRSDEEKVKDPEKFSIFIFIFRSAACFLHSCQVKTVELSLAGVSDRCFDRRRLDLPVGPGAKDEFQAESGSRGFVFFIFRVVAGGACDRCVDLQPGQPAGYSLAPYRDRIFFRAALLAFSISVLAEKI